MAPTSIPGTFLIESGLSVDSRGSFAKPWSRDIAEVIGHSSRWTECYWSTSAAGVIRGMHFQVPPSGAAKLVWCAQGVVLDVLLDLRVGSPTFAQSQTFMLDAAVGTAVFVPVGVAHGFAVLDAPATVCYLMDHEYDPQCDAGILWSSVGVAWPHSAPVMSQRDLSFPRLEEWDSPFDFATSVEPA